MHVLETHNPSFNPYVCLIQADGVDGTSSTDGDLGPEFSNGNTLWIVFSGGWSDNVFPKHKHFWKRLYEEDYLCSPMFIILPHAADISCMILLTILSLYLHE